METRHPLQPPPIHAPLTARRGRETADLATSHPWLPAALGESPRSWLHSLVHLLPCHVLPSMPPPFPALLTTGAPVTAPPPPVLSLMRMAQAACPLQLSNLLITLPGIVASTLTWLQFWFPCHLLGELFVSMFPLPPPTHHFPSTFTPAVACLTPAFLGRL